MRWLLLWTSEAAQALRRERARSLSLARKSQAICGDGCRRSTMYLDCRSCDPLCSEHSSCIAARDIGGDQGGRVFWITEQLQGVPMLYSVSVGVHFVDIDTGDSRILRVIVEQIQEIHVSPHVIADCDDAVDDNPGASAFARNLPKNCPSATGPSGMSGLCWMYAGLTNLAVPSSDFFWLIISS